MIAGITYALEKQKKTSGGVDDDVIENIKVALMGPTAGIGDAFFFNCLRVIAAGIAIGLCAQANFLGVILFVLIYGFSQFAAAIICCAWATAMEPHLSIPSLNQDSWKR